MTVESRIIEINPAAINHGRLNIRACGQTFFPKDAIGGPSKEFAASGRVRLYPEGIYQLITTDLVTDQFGRPRWMFRDRSWVKKFIKANNFKKGDRAFILRVSPNAYRITPLWKPFTFIDLFAGIGGIRLAFENVGGKNVFSSEIDPLAQQTYRANFGEKPAGDITKIPPDSIPKHDILVAGFPCQSFSIIGNQKGFADVRGTLFFYIEEILRVKRPRAVLLENVKQFKTHDEGRTYQTVINCLHELGYYTHCKILNALDYGVPQKRERTFIVGFQKNIDFAFPLPFSHRPSLNEIIEPDTDVNPKLLASEYIQKKRSQRLKMQMVKPFYPSVWHENKGGYIGIHPFSCALRANASYNYLLINGKRRPSGRECLRLQGFPDSFKIVVPHAAIRAQAGNAVAVPLVTAIASRMMVAMHKNKTVCKPLFECIGSKSTVTKEKGADSIKLYVGA